jgi:histidyl-tRNA synthetase
MYLKKKGIKAGLGLANFLDIPISVIVGKKELESGIIEIKDMKNEQQYSVEISKAALKIDMILKKK